jgi:hypothetical protein
VLDRIAENLGRSDALEATPPARDAS